MSNARTVPGITPEALASLDAPRVFERLATSDAGLSGSESAARAVRFGPNRPSRPPEVAWYWQLGAEFWHLFALLLWASAALAWFAGMPELSVAIVVVIVVNGVFSFWQLYRAEQAVEALESLLPRQVRARRDGRECTLAAENLVPGDLLLLDEGLAIPADARIVKAEGLRVDMSSLTGESRPVSRYAGPCDASQRSTPEFENLALAGTFVVSGRAEAVVFATGDDTEFGRLARLTHAQERRVSPLHAEIRQVIRVIMALSISLGLAFFLLGWGSGRLTALEGFVFALGVIVANVPEGLLPTISLALAIGVRRMARRNAIVKRLERVETLGAVTVIVTDKTGTLTLNQMTARGLWSMGTVWNVAGEGYQPTGEIAPLTASGAIGSSHDSSSAPPPLDLLLVAALCCNARLVPPVPERDSWEIVGDPMEAAILVAARKLGIDERELERYPRFAELPFDSLRKRMSTLQRSTDGPFVCCKGAADEVLPRCSREFRHASEIATGAWRDQALMAAKQFADQGWRVLAVARRPLPLDADNRNFSDSPGGEIWERDLEFLGLIAFEDPPRREVPRAIEQCREAGIRVVMATGDDGRTAAAIGREIKLLEDAATVVTGRDLDQLDANQLALKLGLPGIVFARVSPTHKLRIVEALQSRGEVVAVTGDGVNDAPALKRADVGVAMGARGTDVARAAADVILLDDNFATIVAAIEEGRAIYDNVRKFVTYIFASNVPELVPFLAFVLFRIPLPLTVMQILAVDLGTDLLPALALGIEPPEPEIMRRPPRAARARVLSWRTLLRAYAWLGALEAALGLSGFFAVYWLAGWRPGQPLAESGPLYVTATTMSLAAIIACQLGNGLACRSERQSIFTLGIWSNRPLWWAMAAEVVVLVALLYLPPAAKLFQLGPLELKHWLLLATFGPALLAVEELRKRVSSE